jgi:hypothetical protein
MLEAALSSWREGEGGCRQSDPGSPSADAPVLLREKRLPEPQRLVLQQELVRVQAVLAGIRSQPAPACPAAAER